MRTVCSKSRPQQWQQEQEQEQWQFHHLHHHHHHHHDHPDHPDHHHHHHHHHQTLAQTESSLPCVAMSLQGIHCTLPAISISAFVICFQWSRRVDGPPWHLRHRRDRKVERQTIRVVKKKMQFHLNWILMDFFTSFYTKNGFVLSGCGFSLVLGDFVARSI